MVGTIRGSREAHEVNTSQFFLSKYSGGGGGRGGGVNDLAMV